MPEKNLRDLEMLQPAKSLQYKHEGMGLDPQNPFKKLDIVV